jgi:protein-S-isoprenylcysteine O-methyltransferase Ste14
MLMSGSLSPRCIRNFFSVVATLSGVAFLMFDSGLQWLSMTDFISFIGTLWLAFFIYWLVSAAQSKKTVRGKSWWHGALIRVMIFILILWIIQSSSARTFLLAHGGIVADPIVGGIGVLLCVAGMALAVWARVHIGRNWGTPMSLKENPELVTSGPYQYIRHPIYSGMLLAILGSALVGGLVWLIVFVAYGAYFIYGARVEEQIMTRQFPDQYPGYKKQTKMIIPFVW